MVVPFGEWVLVRAQAGVPVPLGAMDDVARGFALGVRDGAE